MSEVEGFVKDLSAGELVIWRKEETTELMGKRVNAVRAGRLGWCADLHVFCVQILQVHLLTVQQQVTRTQLKQHLISIILIFLPQF